MAMATITTSSHLIMPRGWSSTLPSGFSLCPSLPELRCKAFSSFPSSIPRTSTSIYRDRRRRRRGEARAALPIISSVPIIGPLANFILSPLVLLAVYAFGATRFFSGFSRTTYTDALPTKLGLTLTWPVLFAVSQAFRNNFKKAVK